MTARRRTPLYARIWRWHFFAGLFVAPLACVLAVSGSAYLFRPQIDAAMERWIARDASDGSALPEHVLLSAALKARPGASLHRLILPRSAEDRTLEVQLRGESGTTEQLWVDRASGRVLYASDTEWLPMELAKRIHGELLGGWWGSALVELGACWLIVLTLSGLYLSWPRGQRLREVLLPRLDLRSRLGLRNFHGALGLGMAVLLLIFLGSGLPWTGIWGKGFDAVQGWLGQAGPAQVWSVTLQSHRPSTSQADGIPAWERSSGTESTVSLQSRAPSGAATDIGVQGVVTRIAHERLPPPVEVAPPRDENGVWTVRSMTQYRPGRLTLHYDRWSGEELMRIRFSDHPPLARAISYGIAFHEGALFGPLNQAIGVLVALGILGLSVTGLLTWWRRRPQGALAAPPLPAEPRIAHGLAAGIMCLAVLLPTVGASLVFVAIGDGIWSRLARWGAPTRAPSSDEVPVGPLTAEEACAPTSAGQAARRR